MLIANLYASILPPNPKGKKPPLPHASVVLHGFVKLLVQFVGSLFL